MLNWLQERHESNWHFGAGTELFNLHFISNLVTIKRSLKYIWTDGLQPSTSESWVISHSLFSISKLRKLNDLTYNIQVQWTFTPKGAGCFYFCSYSLVGVRLNNTVIFHLEWTFWKERTLTFCRNWVASNPCGTSLLKRNIVGRWNTLWYERKIKFHFCGRQPHGRHGQRRLLRKLVLVTAATPSKLTAISGSIKSTVSHSNNMHSLPSIAPLSLSTSTGLGMSREVHWHFQKLLDP